MDTKIKYCCFFKMKYFLLFVLQFFVIQSQAQQCNAGGCTSFGSNYPAGTFSTVSATWTTVASNIYGSEWAYYSVSSGSTYQWSLCTSHGGYCGYDGQLTLTSQDGSTRYCYSDDICDSNDPWISWTASFTGTVRVLVNEYNCVSNSTNTTLVWRCSNYVPPCTAGSISGAPATICTGSNVTYTWAGTGTFTNFQYQWDGTGGAWTDWGATNPYTWASSWAGHTLYVRAKIAGGTCYSPAVSTLVQDNVAYAGTISPSSSGICAGSSVTLQSIDNSSALGNPTLYIRWYRWDGSSWTFITQNNSQTLTDTPPGVGNYTYLRRTWTSCGSECNPACYDATTMVAVGTASTAATSITATPNPACAGNTTTLTVNGGSLGTGASWIWGNGSCGPVYNETWGALWATYWKGSTTTNCQYVDKVNITSTTNDPMIGMESVGSFDPSIYKYIQIRYRVVSGTAGNAEIFYTNDRSPVAVGDQMVSGPLISDGQWHSLTIDMSAGTYWNGYGNIRGWRYDWCTSSGVTMDLDNISLSAGQGSSVTMNISANTTYYVMAEGICNTTACVNVPVTTISGLPATPYAGEDQYICGTSTTMAATGSGTWSQISGPNTPNIVNTSLTTTQIGTVTGFISGTYVFRWSATNACGTSYDDVVIIKQ